MQVKFVYFGMIAEKLGTSEEILELSKETNNARSFLLNKYPVLNTMSFSVAIDQELQDEITSDSISEIAVLPPFAGG